MILAIDATRNKSGGAINHMIGILSSGDPTYYGIRKIHLWSYDKLLNKLPEYPWLVKHKCGGKGKIVFELFWQYFSFPKLLKLYKVDLLLNSDAGTVNRWKPAITMSRDMLSYEPGEISRFNLRLSKIRLLALRYFQNKSLSQSVSTIYLTKYAQKIISRKFVQPKFSAIIPHGVNNFFRIVVPRTFGVNKTINILYVSNFALHKHQNHVVKACSKLKERGYKIILTLAGAKGNKDYFEYVTKVINKSEMSDFVRMTGAIKNYALPQLFDNSNIFVFASSCENMPNTLLEGMAAGMPIACSNRGPMPEVLRNGGVYFDPEMPMQIASAIEKLILDPCLRKRVTKNALKLSSQYTWGRCASQTWQFCLDTYNHLKSSHMV